MDGWMGGRMGGWVGGCMHAWGCIKSQPRPTPRATSIVFIATYNLFLLPLQSMIGIQLHHITWPVIQATHEYNAPPYTFHRNLYVGVMTKNPANMLYQI